MMQTFELCIHIAVKGVIRMTGKASCFSRNPDVLEMGCWNMIEIIYMEALSKRLHFVARKTKLSCFGMFHMGSRTKNAGKNWKDKQRNECEHFSCCGNGNFRFENQKQDQTDRYYDDRDEDHAGINQQSPS